MKDFILPLGGMFLGLCLGVFALVSVMRFVQLRVDNVPISIHVDGKEVYSGTSGCAKIESTGATTIVRIDGGPLCWFPKAYYVSRNVQVKGDKRE